VMTQEMDEHICNTNSIHDLKDKQLQYNASYSNPHHKCRFI
jgi:hypothetical protein